jgi:hypothetical protein
MQENRDTHSIFSHGDDSFSAFSRNKRADVYMNTLQTNGHDLPELDVLLVEWRWPIPGRNCGGAYSDPDLDRQTQLLRHYSGTKTKIIVWDLDHKLSYTDEMTWRPDAIFETSVFPRLQHTRRTRVEPPFVIDDLLQFKTLDVHSLKKLVYVGSRYERDEIITEYVKSTSDAYPGQVEFYGNWSKTIDECKSLWPNISFRNRITTRGFRKAYGDAAACPLLAKKSYIKSGFMTPRVWESVLFGTIPVSIGEMYPEYTVHSAWSGRHMLGISMELSNLSWKQRDLLRQELAHRMRFMDAKYFVDKIEGVTNGKIEETHGKDERESYYDQEDCVLHDA